MKIKTARQFQLGGAARLDPGGFAHLYVLAVLAVTWFVTPDGSSAIFIWPCLTIFYICAATTIWTPRRISPDVSTFLTIQFPFTAFYYALFLWPYQKFVLGMDSLHTTRFGFTSDFVADANRAVVLAVLGYVAFIGGLRPEKHDCMSKGTSRTSMHRPLPSILPTIILAVLTALIVAHETLGLRSQGEGRYTDTASGGLFAEGVSILAAMFAMLAFCCLAYQLSSHRPVGATMTLACTLSFFWAVRVLILGDRNTFLLICMTLICGLFTFRFRLGRIGIVSMVIAAILLYNAVELARNSNKSATLAGIVHSLSVSDRPGQLEQDSSFDITTVTVRAAIGAVPTEVDWGLGEYKAIGLAGVFPLVRGQFLGESEHVDTAGVLSEVLLPSNAGWGVGTNIISDSYIDFGPLGVGACLFLLGVWARYITHKAVREPHRPLNILLYVMTVALFAELPRYAVDFPIRMLTWVALVYVVSELVDTRFRKTRLRHGA